MHEASPEAYNWVIDETNKTNEWQGSLRFAPLELRSLRHHIDTDLAKIPRNFPMEVNAKLVVTCWDQIESRRVEMIEDGNRLSPRPSVFKFVVQKYLAPYDVEVFSMKGLDNHGV